jgi:hypothetical protein|nr:MAG TPA: hypothetical protein [Caudoviricetes sp.]
MKLIDSSEFIKNLTLDTSKGFYGEFMDGSEVAYTSREIDAAVENAPTISAVPVVRCRECIYYKICDEWETGKRMLCEIHHHSYLDHDGDEHFCSWGQRREAEHDKHPSDPL